jgi:hypothetical protein
MGDRVGSEPYSERVHASVSLSILQLVNVFAFFNTFWSQEARTT